MRDALGPDPIRGLLHISGLPLTLVRIALFTSKKAHGLFIFYILRAIHHGNDFALGTASFCSSLLCYWELRVGNYLPTAI
jgi:hypothetical protein